MSKLYGWGAAVVILGALFKINHYPGAEFMLIIGLCTESIIFFFSAFEPPHVEPDWSLVYPELAGMYHDAETKAVSKVKKHEEPQSLTQALDNMLAEAKIEPELIKSLGEGMRHLSENATKMANITEAAAATKGYVTNLETASSSVLELADAYQQTSGVLRKSTDSIAKSAEAMNFSDIDGKEYNVQLQKIAKNLATLNNVYELQLQNTQANVDAGAAMQEGITKFIQYLNSSIDNTRKYEEEAAKLTSNVKALNQVYGNMLAAMNVRG
ncbi:MAG TPA: gliding motility protein GldL [Bacteroidales bacterium]|nr:gliding motility protein GldL [Bacteroidales bacterium]HRZ48329.1 gliding motility protein GldL [Bacteroidales bacterium]